MPEQSIFTINGAAIQSRVQALPWVASAVVTTQLPATVEISVVERAPMLRIRRDGTDTLVASDGATLPGIDATPAARSGIPVLIDDRAGSPQPSTRCWCSCSARSRSGSTRCSAAPLPPTSGERTMW